MNKVNSHVLWGMGSLGSFYVFSELAKCTSTYTVKKKKIKLLLFKYYYYKKLGERFHDSIDLQNGSVWKGA